MCERNSPLKAILKVTSGKAVAIRDRIFCMFKFVPPCGRDHAVPLSKGYNICITYIVEHYKKIASWIATAFPPFSSLCALTLSPETVFETRILVANLKHLYINYVLHSNWHVKLGIYYNGDSFHVQVF